MIAGILAFFIDFFALKAYAGGLPLTIGGPLIIGGSMAVATTIGFILGDVVTLTKLLALLLLFVGAILLAAAG